MGDMPYQIKHLIEKSQITERGKVARLDDDQKESELQLATLIKAFR